MLNLSVIAVTDVYTGLLHDKESFNTNMPLKICLLILNKHQATTSAQLELMF